MQSFQEATTDSVQQQMVSFDLLFAVVSSLDSHGLEEAIKIAELVIQVTTATDRRRLCRHSLVECELPRSEEGIQDPCIYLGASEIRVDP